MNLFMSLNITLRRNENLHSLMKDNISNSAIRQAISSYRFHFVRRIVHIDANIILVVCSLCLILLVIWAVFLLRSGKKIDENQQGCAERKFRNFKYFRDENFFAESKEIAAKPTRTVSKRHTCVKIYRILSFYCLFIDIEYLWKIWKTKFPKSFNFQNF